MEDKKIELHIKKESITIFEKTVDLGLKSANSTIKLYKPDFRNRHEIFKIGHKILKSEKGPEYKKFIGYVDSFYDILKTNPKGMLKSITRMFKSPRLSLTITGESGQDWEKITKQIINWAHDNERFYIDKLADRYKSENNLFLPDDKFRNEVSGLLKTSFDENDYPDEGYRKFRKNFMDLCVDGKAEEALKLRNNSQKSKKKDRVMYAKMIIEELNDLVYYCHELAMNLIFQRLTKLKGNYCTGKLDKDFYKFFSSRHTYFAGILPTQHALGEIFLRWDDFLSSAGRFFLEMRRTRSRKLSLDTAANFYGRIHAGVWAYSKYTELKLSSDRERKRYREILRKDSGEDVDNIIIDQNK